MSVFVIVGLSMITGCGSDDDNAGNQDKPGTDKPGTENPGSNDKYEPTVPYLQGPWMNWTYAKGADVSYVTQMEDEGYKFRHTAANGGDEDELMSILKNDCGVNAIRLRVWVNPKPMKASTGKIYNDLNDVLVKARRASRLGLSLMIDFHFSDYWADPGKQTMPVAWQGKSVAQIKDSISAHITKVLGALKTEGITPRWVQIGNEVSWGMLWDPKNPSGGATSGQPNGDNYNSVQHKNFAEYIQTGVNTVKSISKDICTIVHVDKAQSEYPARWIFDILKYHDVTYDMIGLSLYPTQDNSYNASNYLQNIVQPAIDNAATLSSTYGRPVIFAEVGMPWDNPDGAAAMLQKLLDAAKTNKAMRGIFYWEPEANPYWEAEGNGKQGYTLGGFDPQTNSPTQALSPFITNNN